MSRSRLLFQIGFNKCATSALFRLFLGSGHRPLHSGGRYWRVNGHPALAGRKPQLEIHRNIAAGRRALSGFEDFDAFFDMELVGRHRRIENYRQFVQLARDYPHAKFLLNHRDKQAWLRSRARHKDGAYLALAESHSGLDRDGVLQLWSDDFDRHIDAVREHFLQESDRLLEFDSDNTPLEDLLAFTASEFQLNAGHWKQVRVTDDVAARLNWSADPAAAGRQAA